LGYGTTSYNLTGQYVMVDGERRFIGTLVPENDNYDFAPGNQSGLLEWARWGTGLLLDPLGRGTTVPMQFTGTPLSVDWSAEDVANLAQTYGDATQDGRAIFQSGPWSLQTALGFGQLAIENGGEFLWQFPEAADTVVVGAAGLYAGGARLLYAGGVLGSTFLLSGDARADESAAGAGLMGVEGWLLPSQPGADLWDGSPVTLGGSFEAVPSGVPGLSLNYGSSYGTLAGEAYDPFTVFGQGPAPSPAWTSPSTSALSFGSFESAAQIAGIGFSLTSDIGSGGFASAATYAFTPGQTSNSIFDDSQLTDYSPTYNYSGNGYADYDSSGSDFSGPDFSGPDFSGYHYTSDDWGSLSFDDFSYDSDFGFPVVLDLAGTGLNITPQSSSNFFYDMAGDGYRRRARTPGRSGRGGARPSPARRGRDSRSPPRAGRRGRLRAPA
jgi:hypothetical protein